MPFKLNKQGSISNTFDDVAGILLSGPDEQLTISATSWDAFELNNQGGSKTRLLTSVAGIVCQLFVNCLSGWPYTEAWGYIHDKLLPIHVVWWGGAG